MDRPVVLHRSDGRAFSVFSLALAVTTGVAAWVWADRMLLPALGFALLPLALAFFTTTCDAGWRCRRAVA